MSTQGLCPDERRSMAFTSDGVDVVVDGDPHRLTVRVTDGGGSVTLPPEAIVKMAGLLIEVVAPGLAEATRVEAVKALRNHPNEPGSPAVGAAAVLASILSPPGCSKSVVADGVRKAPAVRRRMHKYGT